MTIDALLPAAFAAGFFGSTHCLAMCGAIVLLFEHQNAPGGGSLARRVAYNIGRMSFYVVLGVLAGASGALLLAGLDQGLMLLRVLAGALIILLGLNLAFDYQLLRFLEQPGAILWKRMYPLAKRVLPIRSLPTALAAGFVWGALPCGLVYSAVALAATGGSAAAGGAVMMAFWLGTLPALLLAGASADRVHRFKSRLAYRRLAGAIMIVVGAIALSLPLMHGGGGSHDDHDRSRTIEKLNNSGT